MELWKVLKILPTDYKDYGGEVVRWEDVQKDYPDCSSGCKYYLRLSDDNNGVKDPDWGVCANPNSPRAGLLTWEHQAGFDCFDSSIV